MATHERQPNPATAAGKGKMRMTLEEIGRRVGLHHSTLSRWRRGERRLAPATERKVRAAIAGLAAAERTRAARECAGRYMLEIQPMENGGNENA